MINNYAYADRVVKAYQAKLIRLFDNYRSDILPFDELNVVNKLFELYRETDKLMRGCMTEILEAYSRRKDVSDLLYHLLDTSNPVTKYQYSNEIDRRRARLFEALNTKTDSHTDYDRALRDLGKMMSYYGILATDDGTLAMYEDDGVLFVRWLTEGDEKVCDECSELDGKVFPIKEVPPKPHVRCRCWKVPATYNEFKVQK